MKDFLVYVVFRFIAGIFGLFPESWVRFIGEQGGEWAARRRSGRFPLLKSHMRRAMGDATTDSELDAAVHGMYRSYGRYWAETFWFRPRKRSALIAGIERVNFDPVFASMEAGRGRIFVLPHIGNWEVAGMIAEEIGSPVVAVAEHLPNEHITKWFLDVRARFGIGIVLTSDPYRNRKLLKVLADGGAVALLADRDVTGRGVEVEFFGERTTMPAGPVRLALATGADLLPVGAFFQDGKGHRIVVHDPIDLPNLASKDENLTVCMGQLAEALEDVIRLGPTQWHLFQPNWPSDERFVASEEERP